jgi:hypothetical protein
MSTAGIQRRSRLPRPAALAGVLILTMGLVSPAAVSATHVDLAWLTSGVGSWHWQHLDDERTVTSTFDDFTIAVGDPVTVDIRGIHYHYFDPGPDGCRDENPADSTVAVEEFFLVRVDQAETIWDMLESPPTAELIVLPGSGTHHTSTHTCINPAAPPRNEFASDIHFTFSSAATASLSPGCYQPSPYNPETSHTPSPTGSIAVLSVGGVNCDFNDPGMLTVTAGYSYSGQIAGNAVGMLGVDSIVVTGSPTGLALVSQVCVESSWSATVQIRVATSLRLLWHQVLALELPETIAVTVQKPNKHGLFKGAYSESLKWVRCVVGSSHNFPALPVGTGLSIVHPSPFTGVSHSARVWAVLTDGRTLPVAISSSKAKPGTVSWAKVAAATFDLQ